MLSLGIASPVTRETAGALFHQQLSMQVREARARADVQRSDACDAYQLADFLAPHLERSHGVMTLPDVYCLFNRARGTELVSPDDIIKACALWDKLRVGLRMRRFDSGVLAVQSAAHSDDAMAASLDSLAAASADGISATDAARALGLTPAVAREHLRAAEACGVLCRDDAPDGLRFFRNPWRSGAA